MSSSQLHDFATGPIEKPKGKKRKGKRPAPRDDQPMMPMSLKMK
jgi:hypothetical protein